MMDQDFMQNFMTKLRADDELFERFLASVRAGTNKLYLRQAEEKLLLDDSWIFTIEGVLYSIEMIAKNPRKFIKEEDSIVDVERARRTTAKTVRHLASHTRNIRTVEADGNVVPRKVLTTELLEDVAIYENRFVGALVHRLFAFVEKRRAAIGEHIDMYVDTALNFDSKFRYGDNEMTYKLELGVKESPRDAEYADHLREMMEKIETVLKRLRILLGGDFMKAIDKTKPVRPPIQKTNMLRMQQDYRNCYQLWIFLSSYTSLGYSVEVKDKTLPVDADYYDDLTVITGLSMQAMLQNGVLNREKYEAIAYSEPVRKDFKNLSKIEFEADFKYDKEHDDDVVNEYYYQQMKSAFRREAKRPESDDPALQEKEMQMSFMRYFRAVAKVNDLMYRDLIRKQSPREAGRTPLQKKESAYAAQAILVKRMRQLNKLKSEDLERTVKQERKEIERLEKCQQEIEKERVRIAKHKEVLARQKEAAERAKEKARLAREREAAQRAAEALAKRENARIAREAVAAQRAAEQKVKERQAKLAAKERERQKIAEQKAKERRAAAALKEKERQKAALAKQREREKAARQKAAAAAAEKVRAAKQREKEREAKKKAAAAAAEKVRLAKQNAGKTSVTAAQGSYTAARSAEAEIEQSVTDAAITDAAIAENEDGSVES